jgi:hypothetical protein
MMSFSFLGFMKPCDTAFWIIARSGSKYLSMLTRTTAVGRVKSSMVVSQVFAVDSKSWIVRLVWIPSCVQAATSMSCSLSRCDVHTGPERVSPLQTCRIHLAEQ